MDTKITELLLHTKPEELAERCLRSNSHLALKNISCHYQAGVLVLRGCLPTYYLKQLAQETVMPHLERRRLDNRVTVERAN